MGEAADNKILLLLKNTKREEESEANKLLTMLRGRAKGKEPGASAEPAPVETRGVRETPIAEVFSIPGLQALHLFSFVQGSTIRKSFSVLSDAQGGWLRYFLCLDPFVAREVAGLPGLPINKELSAYHDKLSFMLHRLMVRWRLNGAVMPEEDQIKELDEMLIQLLEKLKIMVKQGRLQQVSNMEPEEDQITFLCVLKPDSFTTASHFLQRNGGSLFAHLAFMITLMAQEVVTSCPGQLKDAIAIGESMQRLREKLHILVHRLAMRTQLARDEWEENARIATLMTLLFNQLASILSRKSTDTSRNKGGANGLL